jgi:ferredoxin
MTKVKVINDACIGCGACQSIVPNVFDINDEGYAYAKVDIVTDDIKDDVLDAVESCPTGAIEIEED